MSSPSPLDRLRGAAEVLELAPAHVAALLVLASLACAGLVGLWWLARPAPDAAVAPVLATSAPTAAPGAAAGAAAAGTGGDPVAPGGVPGATAPAAGEVVVHVSGAVASEGVLTLPGGARVVDVVEAAGGARPTARTEQLNLARPVQDGEQVHVPTAREVRTGVMPGGAAPAGAAAGGAPVASGAPGAAGAGAGGGAAPGATVSLNRATATELEALPGVGPVLAQRLIEHREEIGAFTSVEQLLEIDGIGEQTLAELRDHVAP